MCGIAGMVRFDGGTANVDVVRRMIDAIAHRGPDGEGLWQEGGAAFGHRRLAIRDLSPAGRQPMLDDSNGICVTYNGEIYNYAALRCAIEKESSYVFRSSCDTEILPVGWRLWGEELFERIEGMFAVAIWDKAAQTLILARDSIGIKPLYFAQTPQTVLFASELKGLLASSMVPRDVDPRALHTFLAAGYTDRDDTLLRHARQVPPGTLRRIDRTGIKDRCYWRPRRDPVIHDLREAADAVRVCFGQVASDMLAADVPVGMLLSSGVDSSLIAFTLKHRVASYTASFDERSHDETEAAREIARAAGCSWMPVPIAAEESVAIDFVHSALAVDGQLADSSCMAHYVLSREVRRHVKVALAGDGADEFFGGYPTYVASRIAGVVGPIMPGSAARHASSILWKMGARREGRLPWQDVAARFFAALSAPRGAPHAEWRRIAPASLLPKLYGASMRSLLEEDPLGQYRSAALSGKGSLLDRCLLADQTVYLPADMLVKVDRASMAHGLEIRVPFLDRRMMDLAGQIHGKLLSPLRGPTKRVLRAVLDLLGAPDDVARRPKLGFNVPLARWLRHELRPLGDQLIERRAELFEPFLSPDGLRSIWRAHCSGQENHSYTLWALLVFGVWRQSLESASNHD